MRYELYDIITLDDDKQYVLSYEAFYNEKKYYLLIETNDQEELLEGAMLVRSEIENDQTNLYMIQDEQELETVHNIFQKLIEAEEK